MIGVSKNTGKAAMMLTPKVRQERDFPGRSAYRRSGRFFGGVFGGFSGSSQLANASGRAESGSNPREPFELSLVPPHEAVRRRPNSLEIWRGWFWLVVGCR